MNKNYKSEQNGRSMVEMLGVLAVIGVLSITGISGYTTAMNKHKANEILDAASKRAVAVSTQIQRGNTNPTLAEFEDNEVGGAKFNTTVEKVGSSQFKLTFATAPSDDVKAQIKSMTGDGTGTVLVDDNVSRFLYNNDLSAGVSNTNNRDTSDATKCATGYKGIDCDTCDTGYESDGNGACVEIPTCSGTQIGSYCFKLESGNYTHPKAYNYCLSLNKNGETGWHLATKSEFESSSGSYSNSLAAIGWKNENFWFADCCGGEDCLTSSECPASYFENENTSGKMDVSVTSGSARAVYFTGSTVGVGRNSSDYALCVKNS